MSLKRENKFDANTKMYILKLKSRDANKAPVPPYFEVSEKDATTNKWTPTSQTTFVGGKLVKVEIRDWEYENEPQHNINLYLSDGTELYLLDLKLNILSRSLLNQVLNLKTFENLSISTYVKKSKKDDKEYPAISLRQNDELVNWAFGLEEMPKATEIMFKGKKMRDFSVIDQFVLDKVEEFAKKVGGKKVESVNTVETSPQAPQDVDDKDSIPF